MSTVETLDVTILQHPREGAAARGHNHLLREADKMHVSSALPPWNLAALLPHGSLSIILQQDAPTMLTQGLR